MKQETNQESSRPMGTEKNTERRSLQDPTIHPAVDIALANEGGDRTI